MKKQCLALAHLPHAIVIISALVASGSSAANGRCSPVNAQLAEEIDPNGTSLILNTKGRVTGTVQGEYFFEASELSDTMSDVEVFRGNSRIVTKRGTIMFEEAGGIDLGDPDGNGQIGDFADLLTVRGGDGEFAGATGHVFLSGFLNLAASPPTGNSELRGVICR